MNLPLFRSLACLSLVAVLSACASVRVDSEVSAFSKLPPAPALAGGYRFEQLPSQQANPQRQAQIEALAQPVLQRAGLARNDQAARYSVQLGIQTQRGARSGWDDDFWWHARYGWGPYWRSGFGWPHHGTAYPLGYPSSPQYRHEVTVLLRDLNTQQIVFESRAVHEGLWASAEKLLPALVEAALRDFPNPPAGVRRVEVELPRQ
ncbi:MAG: DUF4136 domain-containing protein [Pseudomonadota bacterium]